MVPKKQRYVMSDDRGYLKRPPGLPIKDGRVDFTDEDGLKQMLELIGDAPLPPVTETAGDPFVGVTTDGAPITGLFLLSDDAFDSIPAESSARAYLAELSPDDRARAVSAIDSVDWRLWTNAFLVFPEHGLRLENMTESAREAALAIVRASISAAGFAQVRGAMRLNGELGDFLGEYLDTLTEYHYWFTVFGTPSNDQPWGWQLQGHHVDVNCFIIGRKVVLTPSFLGAEFKSDQIFAEHRSVALEFLGSLSAAQRGRAVLYDSIRSNRLPKELAGPVEGRHRAGAGRDNLMLPYEGLVGADLSAGQRELLSSVLAPYVGLLPEGAREAKRAEINHHLDDSWFAWIGGDEPNSPFYYKVHSPVVLVEYDNHPGVFLDYDEPEPFHVHTIIRTPNGGDYGKDLLAQHYARHHH